MASRVGQLNPLSGIIRVKELHFPHFMSTEHAAILKDLPINDVTFDDRDRFAMCTSPRAQVDKIMAEGERVLSREDVVAGR